MKKLLALLFLAVMVGATIECQEKVSVNEMCMLITPVVTNYSNQDQLCTSSCTIDIINDTNHKTVSAATMSGSNGFYNYSFIESRTGIYRVYVDCDDCDQKYSAIVSVGLTEEDYLQNINSTLYGDHSFDISDFGEVVQDDDYKLKIWVYDQNHNPVDADNTPKVQLYDSLINLIAQTSMTKESTGIYSYSYTTSDSSTDGVWEAIVNLTYNGVNHYPSDYFEVESSPAEVRVINITDNTITDLAALVNVTNEGSSGYEYQYRWWVTDDVNGQYGDASMKDYGTGAKYINAGATWQTTIPFTLQEPGIYYFKILVYYGSERSGASKMFHAFAQEAGSGGGGGFVGGATGVTTTTLAGAPQTTFVEKYWLWILIFIACLLYDKNKKGNKK